MVGCGRDSERRGNMRQKTILLAGASAVGKTALLTHLLRGLSAAGEAVCACKIDCIQTEDDKLIRAAGFPCVVGIGGDICPDHFLVSNLEELWQWSQAIACPTLVIETAGLCHRCSPATKSMVAGCVVDATASSKTPEALGPMLSEADFVVLSKIDLVSQAEREIFAYHIRKLNPKAVIFPVDSLAYYGIEPLYHWLSLQSFTEETVGDSLRYTMPSGVCSYCVGETRVGNRFQQGVVGKISFPEV